MNLLIKPSSIINIGWIMVIPFGFYMSPFLGGLVVLIFIYKMIEVYCWRYEFYDDIIIERKGVFLVTHRELNYYRIKSVFVEEPLLHRLVDIGNIHVVTSDKFANDFTFTGVSMVHDVANNLRGSIVKGRKRNNVREYDLYNM